MQKKPKLMAVLNVTPDSYYTTSSHTDPQKAIEYGNLLIQQGADILDIGGESTRPGSNEVSEDEELARVIPVIQGLNKTVPLSIDTKKPKVAQAALKAGASIINDITGFEDPAMVDLAVSTQVPICVMHMQGTPKTMQINPHYEEGIVEFLMTWFENKINCLVSAGVQESHIILDPGIGFGKTVAHNLEIIHNLARLKTLGFPVLIGLSRKSFMGKILKKSAPELLSATLAMNAFVLINRADIIRVHDVLEHRDVIDVLFSEHT
jgi:dihydropteroate synthase